jgi:hypothetical protein
VVAADATANYFDHPSSSSSCSSLCSVPIIFHIERSANDAADGANEAGSRRHCHYILTSQQQQQL